MKVTDEYLDVLQNLEVAIIITCRHHPSLTDLDVILVLQSLADDYSGERIGRPPRPVRLEPFASELRDAVRSVCEWRLGRAEAPFEIAGKPPPPPPPLTPEELLLCLKRLVKSAKRWNKEEGIRGYLSFVSHYVV